MLFIIMIQTDKHEVITYQVLYLLEHYLTTVLLHTVLLLYLISTKDNFDKGKVEKSLSIHYLCMIHHLEMYGLL